MPIGTIASSASINCVTTPKVEAFLAHLAGGVMMNRRRSRTSRLNTARRLEDNALDEAVRLAYKDTRWVESGR